MLGFIVFALILACLWLASRISKTDERMHRLEAELQTLREELQRRTESPAKPAILPDDAFDPAPTPPLLVHHSPGLRRAPEPALDLTPPPEPPAEPLESTPPPLPPEVAPSPQGPAIDWEQFLGVKLFAWVGGLALFIGIAFFLKFSFERNLIPPAARIAMGFLTGAGLIAGGVLMRRRDYRVTSHTLTATGVVALYGSTFAAHALYQLFGTTTAFAIMSLVTAAAFILAVRLEAIPVAVLGIVGGFLTPPLLSSAVDRPLSLFGYVTLLNLGLMAVAFKKQWHFLILLGAIGTVLTEAGWFLKFFKAGQSGIAFRIASFFGLLFVAALFSFERRSQRNQHTVIAVFLQATAILGLAAVFVTVPQLSARPGLILSTIFLGDLAIIAIFLVRKDLFEAHWLAGVATFLLLAAWVQLQFSLSLMYWAFAAFLLFAMLHTAMPLLLRRQLPKSSPAGMAAVFPIGSLLLVLLMMLQVAHSPFLVWPVVLVIDLMALAVAFLTASVVGAIAAIVVTGLLSAVYLLRLSPEASPMSMVLLVGFFALVFVGAGFWFVDRKLKELGGSEDEAEANPFVLAGIPAISALLPFLLLAMVIMRFEIPNPSGHFTLALVMVVALHWLAGRVKLFVLNATALGAALLLEFLWHSRQLDAANPALATGWFLLFHLVFIVLPFMFRSRMQQDALPWAVAALSGPVHFFLIYGSARLWLGEFPAPGVIPALLSIPSFAALFAAARKFDRAAEHRNEVLAWFGGCALFFITAIFPIQFERQWLTVGLALEGLALVWLFRRIPHPGLPLVGSALLVTSFVRLAFNWTIFGYYPRSQTPILNWYLYTYGIVIAATFAAAALTRKLVLKNPEFRPAPLLYTLGTILSFVLLNIEIAEFFSNDKWLRFEFSGNFARDMTYSIAWALFGLVLLVIGILRRIPPARYAGLGLLVATLLKLFLHDLSQLGQLYRIGAFIGVAVILIFASWLYQRFLSPQRVDRPK